LEGLLVTKLNFLKGVKFPKHFGNLHFFKGRIHYWFGKSKKNFRIAWFCRFKDWSQNLPLKILDKLNLRLLFRKARKLEGELDF